MKYEVHMTVSVGVFVDARNKEVAVERAIKRVEKRIDTNGMFIACCVVDTTEPAAITLEAKRRKAEEALARLMRSEVKVGEPLQRKDRDFYADC